MGFVHFPPLSRSCRCGYLNVAKSPGSANPGRRPGSWRGRDPMSITVVESAESHNCMLILPGRAGSIAVCFEPQEAMWTADAGNSSYSLVPPACPNPIDSACLMTERIGFSRRRAAEFKSHLSAHRREGMEPHHRKDVFVHKDSDLPAIVNDQDRLPTGYGVSLSPEHPLDFHSALRGGIRPDMSVHIRAIAASRFSRTGRR
jgi:hypothetical protein